MSIPIAILAYEAAELAQAIAGPARQRDPMERLLAQAIDQGGSLLRSISRDAVTRLLATDQPHARIQGRRLFTDAELILLAEELAAIRMAARLLSRSLVARQAERARKRHAVKESREPSPLLESLPPLVPEDALEFFRGLLPILGLDPLHLLPDMRRQAFTLAVATETQLLQAVQDAIAGRMAIGAVLSGKHAIDSILDAAGISPRNPQYADMVMRTNYMDAANTGYHEQLRQERDTFPVWRYSNPRDTRSRPDHAARNGLYYPSSVTIDQVRGVDIADKANCRCVPVAISKWDWADLVKSGARIAAGWEHHVARAV